MKKTTTKNRVAEHRARRLSAGMIRVEVTIPKQCKIELKDFAKKLIERKNDENN